MARFYYGRFTAALAYLMTVGSALAVPLTGNTGPGGFERTDIASNLTFWLAADQGVFQDTGGSTPATTTGQEVARWNNLSNAGGALTQSSSTERPTFTTGAINGLPVVSFTPVGTVDYLDGAFSPANGSVGRTIFAVVEPDVIIDSRGILDISADGSGSGGAYAITAEVAIRVTGNQVFDTALSTAAPSVLTTRNRTNGTFGDTGNAEAFINGQALTLDTDTVATATPGAVAFAPNGTITEVGKLQQLLDTDTQFAYDGDTAELAVFDRELNDAERTIVENALSAKYAVALSGSGALDVYAGDDGPINFDRDVFGIGERSIGGGRTAGSVTNAGRAGFGIEESGGTLDLNEWVLAGHDQLTNGLVEFDSEADRWSRVWYVDKTEVDGIDVTMAFDFSDAGLSFPGSLIDYSLLYSADGTSFTELDLAPTILGDTITFAVPNSLLIDGYYTLAQAVPEPSSFVLLGLSAVGRVSRQPRRRRRRQTPCPKPAASDGGSSPRKPNALASGISQSAGCMQCTTKS